MRWKSALKNQRTALIPMSKHVVFFTFYFFSLGEIERIKNEVEKCRRLKESENSINSDG